MPTIASLLRVVRRQRAWQILDQAIRKYFSDNGLFLASGLAYDLLLCCIPLFLLAVSALGYIIGDSDRALADVVNVIKRLLPVPTRMLTGNLSAIVENRGLLGFLGFVLFFLFGSLVFGSARMVLNTVFQIQHSRSFFRGKWMDIVIMLFAGVLLGLTIGTVWLLAFIRRIVDQLPALAELLQPAWDFAGGLLGFLLTLTLFYVLYRFSPAQTLGRKALFLAALTGACSFELSKWAFSIYMQVAKAQVALYGALGLLVFFVLWLYYTSTVFILAAEIGWVYDREGRQEAATNFSQAAG